MAVKVRVFADGFDSLIVRVTGTPGPVATVDLSSGDAQMGEVGMPLPQPISVVARDRFGNPAADVEVGFMFVSGNGSLDKAQILTDKGGLASALVTLGTVSGRNLVAAINQHVGELLRAYIAEAIAREIESWRKGQ